MLLKFEQKHVTDKIVNLHNNNDPTYFVNLVPEVWESYKEHLITWLIGATLPAQQIVFLYKPASRHYS